MRDLQRLPEIAERSLGGLRADANMKAQILWKTSQIEQEQISYHHPKRALAFVCACLVLFAAVGILSQGSIRDPSSPLFSTQAAGSPAGAGNRALLDLDKTKISIGVSASSSSSQLGVWARFSDGSFPLVGIQGRFYRQLGKGLSFGSLKLDNPVAKVETFTQAPSLSSTDQIVSNILPVGTLLYRIAGLGDTLIAAEVDDGIALFQRVSFSGKAIRGSETLQDTLEITGHVTRMRLSGVGTIADPATCDALLEILFANAALESNGTIHTDNTLIMTLDNGIEVQLLYSQESFAGCGVWSCPEFIEAFMASNPS